MENVIEIITKSNKRIILRKERWSHIRKKHPEIEDLAEIENTIRYPDKILIENKKFYYYRYFKDKKEYLLVIIKFLNGEGYIKTSYFVRNIR